MKRCINLVELSFPGSKLRIPELFSNSRKELLSKIMKFFYNFHNLFQNFRQGSSNFVKKI